MDEIIIDSPDFLNPIENPSLSNEQGEYLGELQKTIDFLNNSELRGRWWMIGGIAKDAYTANNKFNICRNGQIRDIDILIKEGDFRSFERVRAQSISKIPLGGFLNRFIHADVDDSFLHFGAIKTNVPSEVFFTNEVELFGVKFPTLPPETLFHLYCLRGEMRPKDFTSAMQIGRFIQKHPSPDLPEEKYEDFHRFSKQIRRPSIHPQAIMDKLSRWYGTTKLGEKLPLTSPAIRSIALHIWDASGLTEK